MTEKAVLDRGDRANPLPESLKSTLLPAMAVRLVLGARFDVNGDQGVVRFEGDAMSMHMSDFDLALKTAKRLKPHVEARPITPGLVIELMGHAQKFMSEEMFYPGALRVIYFPSIAPGSAFYRCLLPALALSGGSKVIAHASRDRMARETLNYDIVVIQIDNSPQTLQFAKVLQSMGKKVVYEIDDAFDAVEPWHGCYELYGSELGQSRVRDMLGTADCVTVTTHALKNRYATLARRIEVLPNYIQLVDWPVAEPHKLPEFRVLWAGSPSHLGDLAIVGEALSNFAMSHPNVELTFFGREPEGLKAGDMRVNVVPWCDFKDYPDTLAGLKADVAIAPLADIPFNHGKSNIKLLEYGATGYPILASDVGPYRETIGRETFDGILCQTQSDWEEALEAVYQRQDLREALRQGAKAMARRYDIERHRTQIENLYLSIREERHA